MQVVRERNNVLRSRIDAVRKSRDNQNASLKRCRKRFLLKTREIFKDETSLMLDLLCNLCLACFKISILLRLVDSARLSSKNKRFAKLKDTLRNECSSIIDNSSDSRIVDSAKLVLGVINYYSGLDKGSLTYFESMQDKSLLQKYAFVEYFITALKYADILEPARSPSDLIKSIDETFLDNTENVYGLIAGINSCRLMSVPDRVFTSRQILGRYLPAINVQDQALLWMNEFLGDSQMLLESTAQNYQYDHTLNIGIMDYKMIDINFCSHPIMSTMASALAWNQALGLTFDESTEVGLSLNSVLQTSNE